MKIFLAVLFVICSLDSFSQKIYGTVYSDKGDLLPFASITVKGTSQGTSANNKAHFSLTLGKGTYVIICQHIGYAAQEKKVLVEQEMEVTFTLSEQKLVMKEVVIKTGGEDPAYEIIRQAIKKRNFYYNEVKAFSCNIYGKDLVKLRKLPKKVFGKKIKDEDKADMGVDSAGKGIIYLSESISKAYLQRPDKFKLEVMSSRVSGSENFGFTFPSFISLYQNNVTVFSERLNPRGFISPIADGALGFYKYKFLGSFFEDGKAINSIQIIPRRNYEPLFSGIINITDNDWRIHSFNVLLTKTAQLELLDTLRITQQHIPVEQVWRTKSQLLYFNMKIFGVDMIGDFLSVYSDYNIAPVFSKKFFDRTIIKYDTAVNKRSFSYWDSTRAVPLAPEEFDDYKRKDSIYQRNKDSVLTSQSIDSLKKRQGNIKLVKLFTSGIARTHYSKTNQYTWGISPLLLNASFNTAEGLVVNANGHLTKDYKKSKTQISFEPLLRYGFNNGHFNPSASLTFIDKGFNKNKVLKENSFTLSGGKRISEYNRESRMHPLTNTIRTLFLGRNFLKIYENNFASASFSKRYESGLRLYASSVFEDRSRLANTTNFTVRKKDTIHLTPNYPYLISGQIPNHQAFLISFEVSFKPGQRYIQLPFNKIPIGSKYPTFTANYVSAIKIFGADARFDKWQFSIKDDKNLKLFGKLNYRLGVGGFLNQSKVYSPDFKHFNRNSGDLNSFQLVEFYANSTTAPFFSFAHLEHHFNGLLTNKIPLFKRLNWNLVAGTDAFYINRYKNYYEIFAGLENIFKVLRVDFIAGYQPGKAVTSGIRFSTGGALGARVNLGNRQNSVSIEL
ncbi:MAG: DUF5686 and carboxypeptidase regulatory-like domain-containing protein [Ferruginibacter sp.]